MPKIKDLTGLRFGRLIVLKLSRLNERHESVWECKCDCGVIKEIVAQSLKKGVTKSCGCYNREIVSKNATKHGLKKHPIYGVWKEMRKRCNNPNQEHYDDYGGRGIKVCERWNDFKNFYDDMAATYQKGLTIERINTNGNYEPNNCKWDTIANQSRNKRNNKILTHNGITLTAADWAAKLGIKRPTLYDRLRHGWNTEDALLGKKR